MRFAWRGLLLGACLLASRPSDGFELTGPKWPSATTTFDVDIPGAGGLWNTAFEDAMASWSVPTKFTYLIRRNSFSDPCNFSDTRNGVAFTSTACGVAWGATTLGISYTVAFGSGVLAETDIIFNSNLSWNVYSGPWGGPEFRRAAVHELGHSLGLDHEDDVPAIMQSALSIGNTILNPTADDIAGSNFLYPVDLDVDNDFVLSAVDNCPATPNPDQIDTDGDALGNACDADDDNDGMPDSYEIANGFDPLDLQDAAEDADGDGFSNVREFRAGTDPLDPTSFPIIKAMPWLMLLLDD
jgi:hypothetical protein